MEKKKIYLNTKEQLRVYMSPQRQNLLRVLFISGHPMTAKEIADRLEISASSAQMHIKKLVKLEILEIDHTERINGITATYFRPADVDVYIGMEKNDDLFEERNAVVQNMTMQIYENAKKVMQQSYGKIGMLERRRQCRDSRSGVFYLKPEDVERLENSIDTFLEEHDTPREGAVPWEWTYLIYNTRYGEEAKEETGGGNGNA